MWAGGKNKMLKHYERYLPTSLFNVESYCEPFFGGGAMFIYMMKNCNLTYARINDINSDIISIYKSIRDNYDEFTNRVDELEEQYLPLSKDDRKKLYFDIRHKHAYDFESWSKPVESATLYFLMKTGFNGIFQINKNTNGRYGTPAGLLNQTDKVYDREVVKWWHDALQITDIMSVDWKEAVQDCPEKTFFFFDPPYRESFADYGKGFTDEQLIELIEFCDQQSHVMLANRDDSNWFAEQNHSLQQDHFDVFYTAGRRKKTEDGHEAKKAREILLYRTPY